VCAWIELYLVHSQGDWFGKPFRLTDDQRRFIWRAYELHGDGSRVVRRALRGRPKGDGKTELTAAIACAELLGPVRCAGFDDDSRPVARPVVSPDIPVAAASFEQADLLFGAARVMLTEGKLAELVEAYDTEVLLRGGPGRMYRVAAVAGTNEGLRPTFFAADELHEWVGNKARVHLVIANGLAKRRDAWEMGITTAGVRDGGSVAEELYEYGLRCLSGEISDETFLFDWRAARDDVDLTKPQELRKAIDVANAAPFCDRDAIVRRFGQIPEHEFRRYHLNQWVNAIEQWDVAARWDEFADTERTVDEGAEVALGFDGSYVGDSTALVGCTVARPHLFVVDIWENPGKEDWRVDVAEAEDAIRKACRRWRVRAVHADPYRWQRTIDVLRDEGFPVVDYPTTSPGRMVPATTQFTEAALAEPAALTHDGDPRLARHVANCVLKIDRFGPRIVKEHKSSRRRIDAAVAAVLAYDGAVRQSGPREITEEAVW
jgi:phage terminase large subunit-like protein